MDDGTILAPNRRKLDVHDLFRMVVTGIVAEHDRVELIDGALVDRPPIADDNAGTLIVHRHPSASGFGDVEILTADPRRMLAAAPDIIIDLTGLFA